MGEDSEAWRSEEPWLTSQGCQVQSRVWTQAVQYLPELTISSYIIVTEISQMEAMEGFVLFIFGWRVKLCKTYMVLIFLFILLEKDTTTDIIMNCFQIFEKFHEYLFKETHMVCVAHTASVLCAVW